MKLYFALFFLLCLFTICGCQDQGLNPGGNRKVNAIDSYHKKERIGLITGIKPDKIEYYKQLHAKAWPAVLKKISDCNIHNYSIYLKKIEDKYFLFSYFEYTGTNLEEDMKKMAADSATQRWWKETNPTQLPLPDATANKRVWADMEEVFHTE